MGEISDDRQTAATGPARGPDPPGGEAPVVGPLVRGLTVLRAMARPGCHRLRPSDLVHATGLARATVDRVVGTLVRLDLLRAAGRDVEITPRLLAFGNAYLAGCGIADALEPFAERLADELDESVSVAVPDGTGVRFVTQVIRRRAMTPVFRIGDLLPADRCAAGMVLGRDAPEWAVDDQRMEQGLIAVAVPVRDPGGRRICGVSVVSNTGRHTAGSLTATALPRLRALLPAMEAAVAGALSGPPLPRPGAGTRSAGAARSDAIVPGPGPAPRAEPAPHGPAPADPAPHEPAPHEPAPDVLAAKRELGAGFLQSLARGLDVLAVLGRDPRGLTLSAAAEATGQPRATARRALLTLQHLGYATSQ
ncbi:helix-turn-helix domain-containing protein, partial [Streptomyces sp. NPDC048845]